MIDALAEAGRNECLWRTAMLPEENQLREAHAQKLCASQELAVTFLAKSRDLKGFRNWFKDNESRLRPNGNGQFELAQQAASSEIPITTDSSSQIWTDLVPEVVQRWEATVPLHEDQAVVIMPVKDQTSAGLGERREALLSAIKQRVARHVGVSVIDE
jgi:hypothetical protein